QAEDGIRDWSVTGVQTYALPICRAECQHGATHRRLRIRAGSRPHRDGRYLRAAAREGRHQGVLPGRQGGRRPRHATLEEEEDVEIGRASCREREGGEEDEVLGKK